MENVATKRAFTEREKKMVLPIPPFRPNHAYKSHLNAPFFPGNQPARMMMNRRLRCEHTSLQARHDVASTIPTITGRALLLFGISMRLFFPKSQTSASARGPNWYFLAASHHDTFAPATACALRLFALWAWGVARSAVAVGVVGHFSVVSSDFADDVVEGVIDVDARLC